MRKNVTFAMVRFCGSENERVIGYIAKTEEDGRLLISFKEFWDNLESTGVFHGNVEDFVPSIIGSNGKMNSALDCCGDLTVVFDSHKYSGSTEIRVYHAVAGIVYECAVDGFKDVTGTVYLPSCHFIK